MDERVRQSADEPPLALPELILPLIGGTQTSNASIFTLSVSWSGVWAVLAVLQMVLGTDTAAGVMQGLVAVVWDPRPPTLVWARRRSE